MRQVLGPGALGRPRGVRWRGRWEGGSGWGTHVNPWLIHVNVWQNPLQCYEVISLQLIKIKEKKTNCILKFEANLSIYALDLIHFCLHQEIQSLQSLSRVQLFETHGLQHVFEPQFKSINSLALSFLYSPTHISIHDYWKNHSLD